MDAKSRLVVCCERDISSNVESTTPSAGDPKARLSPSSSSPALPSPKRSRRSADKRVVWMPIADAKASGLRAKGASESAPPSDSWAWRKYGQKPIKGSPYPRGYYRCSSSKGCPARKQVERSNVDPGMLVVTYSSEHNHSWLLPKSNNSNSRAARAASVVSKEDPVPESDPDPVPSESDPSDDVVVLDKFSGLIYAADDQTLMATPDDFWYPDVGSTSSTSPPDDCLLFGPIFGGELSLDDRAKSGGGGGGNNGEEEEEDALFEGLGELPEYSVVFRRSYVERQMAAG